MNFADAKASAMGTKATVWGQGVKTAHITRIDPTRQQPSKDGTKTYTITDLILTDDTAEVKMGHFGNHSFKSGDLVHLTDWFINSYGDLKLKRSGTMVVIGNDPTAIVAQFKPAATLVAPVAPKAPPADNDLQESIDTLIMTVSTLTTAIRKHGERLSINTDVSEKLCIRLKALEEVMSGVALTPLDGKEE